MPDNVLSALHGLIHLIFLATLIKNIVRIATLKTRKMTHGVANKCFYVCMWGVKLGFWARWSGPRVLAYNHYPTLPPSGLSLDLLLLVMILFFLPAPGTVRSTYGMNFWIRWPCPPGDWQEAQVKPRDKDSGLRIFWRAVEVEVSPGGGRWGLRTQGWGMPMPT